jgi:hypothetical protein
LDCCLHLKNTPFYRDDYILEPIGLMDKGADICTYTSHQESISKKGGPMCYNCGCGIPDDDHGKGHAGVDPEGKSITDKTFEATGKAFGLGAEESKKNTKDLLNKLS